MDQDTFVTQLKKELFFRTLENYEIEQYLIFAKEKKIQLEMILQAINFAKIIKGSHFSRNYILTILNNWINVGLKNPNDVRNYLRSKYTKNNKNRIENHDYTKSQLDSLFDNITQVVL
ncbi:MAG TPA: hypothetical protein DD621_00125 [Clostridiales bacterium]|nr:hypothetical protein [Clostridiales bacterium]